MIETPAGPGSGEPHLGVSPEGAVYLTWFEAEGRGHALRIARLDGETWSEASTIASGDSFFVNWADVPTVLPLEKGRLAVHYPWMSAAGDYAYDVVLRFSDDGGATWGPPILPHTDGTATEHGFVSLLPSAGGVRAVWLDGRNAAAAEEAGSHGHGGADMTLRTAVVRADGALSEEAVLDERVCDCCQTDAATTPLGSFLAYRDRGEDEVRDIALVRLDAAGTWGVPAPLHADGWYIAGCPVNGPALAAAGNRLVAAWYTAAGDTPTVRAAFGSGSDGSLGRPLRVDGGNPIGRVDVALIDGGAAAVIWLEHTGDAAEVRVRRMTSRSGDAALTLDRVSASRASGVPRMVRSGDRLICAWTAPAAPDDATSPSQVRVAQIPLR